MTSSQNPSQLLEDQLEALRSSNSINSAQHILQEIERRVRWQRREVIAAVFGACVAAFGVVFFALQGYPFGYITLTLATVGLIVVTWKSARNATSLASLESGVSLLSAWRTELERQLQHTRYAPFFAVLFLALTLGLIWRDGLLSPKSLAFLVVATVICSFAAHQWLVLRPFLLRELEDLKKDE